MNRSMRAISNRRRDTQGGYALLMIFLMAAIFALLLYQQLPRVAFESEREKEQLLIDRGEQYTRAIQLYYLANNRQYPTSIEDLEKKEKRFLRRRFLDPFTGKDQWRVVHTNGTFLTDSLVTKPPVAADGQSQSASNTSNTTTATATDPQQPQVNAAVLQRPSDRALTPPPGFTPPMLQDFSGQQANGQQANTPLPPITLQTQQGQNGQQALPPITLQAGGGISSGLPPITLGPGGLGGAPQLPGLSPASAQNRANTVAPFPGAPGAGGLPGGIQPNVPPGFQIDANGQLIPTTPVPGQQPGNTGIPGLPFPQQSAGQPGFGQTGTIQAGAVPAQGSPNAALSAINQVLQTPRQNQTAPVASSGNQVGAIAGVASTHQGPSIKTYKDQTKYQMWEFVFNPAAAAPPAAPAAGVGGPGNNGRGGANPSTGTGGLGTGTGLGTGNGFGNTFPNPTGQPTFGNSPLGNGPSR